MTEISRPKMGSEEQAKEETMFGLKEEEYQEVQKGVLEILKEFDENRRFSELRQRMIDITNNKDERDCAMFLMGLFYRVSGSYTQQVEQSRRK